MASESGMMNPIPGPIQCMNHMGSAGLAHKYFYSHGQQSRGAVATGAYVVNSVCYPTSACFLQRSDEWAAKTHQGIAYLFGNIDASLQCELITRRVLER